MDDIAQLKKQLDDTISALRRRLAIASERKAKAEREAESSTKEIAVVSAFLEAYKPVQGYYGAISAIDAINAAAAKTERGHNRKVIVEILSRHGPRTNNEIAKIAHAEGKIKSRKGLPGVYAIVATVLARGKNVFVNHNGQWDLRDRKFAGEGPFTRMGRGETSFPSPPTLSSIPSTSPIPAERVRVAKVGSQ